MPKQPVSRRRSSSRKPQNPVENFFRKPVVQIGLILLVAAVIAVIALIGNPQKATAANFVSVEDAYKIYQQGNAFFLDVRQQSEWDQYHAPNSTLIPLDQLPNRLSELPKDKQIVIVCHSGNRSKQGLEILLKAGLTNVVSMTGGLAAWQTKGYPLAP